MSPTRAPPHVEDELHCLRHETNTLKTENNMLCDKVHSLTAELDQRARSRTPDRAIEAENRHLKAELADKQRENDRQLAQIRELMLDSDKNTTKQRSEWNDLYGSMKRESDDLKRDIRLLNQENERLVKQVEQARTQHASVYTGTNVSSNSEKEVARRLKKRELECQALWETLKDMYSSQRGIFDTRQIVEILSLRALDTKAKRKLGI